MITKKIMMTIKIKIIITIIKTNSIKGINGFKEKHEKNCKSCKKKFKLNKKIK